jgi:hypothetical protein
MVTSRLFPPGTIYASALTPLIVAAVSEVLARPADHVAELRRQRRTMMLESERAPSGEEGAALRGAPDFAQGAAADEELGTVHANGTGDTAPVSVYGRSRSPLLHPKVWMATGLAAFAIAVALLTLPELIFGGAVANNRRTTYFGGGSSSTKTQTEKTPTKTQTQPQQTVTETTTTDTTTTETGTQTTPSNTTTTPVETGTQTTPSNTTTTPTDTGTSTSPGGTAVPPTP